MNSLFRYGRKQVFGQKGDPLIVQRVGTQDVCPPHEHEFIEIVLAVGGSGIQETAQHRLPIKSGTLTVLRPGHWHAYLSCRKLVIYNCCFGPELLRRELSWLMDDPRLARLLWGSGPGKNENTPQVFHLQPAAVHRLKDILDTFSREGESSYGIKISQLCLFLTTLAAELPISDSRQGQEIPVAVRKSIRLIETDLARPWDISALAHECGCSPEYLIRLFKSSIGMPPYSYINRCRAERAANLLLHTTTTIGQLGEQVGWDEPCRFARCFKKYYGISATSYRSQMSKGQKQLSSKSTIRSQATRP